MMTTSLDLPFLPLPSLQYHNSPEFPTFITKACTENNTITTLLASIQLSNSAHLPRNPKESVEASSVADDGKGRSHSGMI